ncbi:transposase [Reichenbachiella sp. 5M10]|uniref:ISAon1 family transposase n=1 Tax=Reichenbachiella sp. 5M10 TaxID=1889772 RepID=UPI000C4AE6A9|nr:transposase [Reichenbachiella sp. 5M10]PIB33926.1 transposase [Reichenbachiella sp. 5M10]PIB34829.1 transposase [Reichenbachiella sp. 5M10]PIB35102.1 transposase [Reichenbachiella sp. 5M10]PIB36059.1 transposase [Reichenbachiella sp. 5M10]
MQWPQREHASDWILFPENMGTHLSIDETALSQGELYTIVTNKAAKGRKGSLVALVKGTDSEQVNAVLKQVDSTLRRKVQEVTLDMAASMEKIVRRSFPKAQLVTDRFHVQKLAYDAVQEMRIAYRWEAIDQENKEIELSREAGKSYVAHRLENGDTEKQLLARSRYLLFKSEHNWTVSQVHRAEILFKHYPSLEKAYKLSRELAYIYQSSKVKGVAFTRLAQWYDKVEKAGFKSFNTVARTIQNHYQSILNFFDHRSTNASAESFNAKIKAFRSQFRGVQNVEFFLYRLSKIYA